MPAIHIHGEGQTPLANAGKDGTDNDVCPVHGGPEVEPVHRIGYGIDGKGEEYMDGAIYNSDARFGGCGDTWGRKTKQGAERDHVHAPDSGAVTLTGGAKRTILLPPQSQEYADNYRRIFGHD